ncbi:hypothetical protein ACP70R_026111 [Stipagrostis hirtigluma subsp. patula]
MKVIHVALFLTVALLVSSSDGTTTEIGLKPNYFQDTCALTISPGPVCDPGKCSTDCTRRFKGGVGGCEPAGCRCIYTCPPRHAPPVM